MKKILPIGNDSFLTIREKNWYYIDKSLMIKDFIEYQDTVALITRPRRFGKTLNMTMLREFFDITKDSRNIFEGLQIMETEYADKINKRPVIFFSFKDCTGKTQEDLRLSLMKELLKEYVRYSNVFGKDIDKSDVYVSIFYHNLLLLQNQSASFSEIRSFLDEIIRVVHDYFNITPVLLIDEYDQPILSSYENGYRKELSDFFSVFYGLALKGNEKLGQVLLTGIQRVAKESIFSKLNNIKVYSVIDRRYCEYFGLTTSETKELLRYYGLELNQMIKEKYNGYLFFNKEVYNPWSVLNYAESHALKNYWINTSTNYLVKKALADAEPSFKSKFEELTIYGSTLVGINLETSFLELQNNSTLWGLLMNSGYITVKEQIDYDYMKVKIPNEEVFTEFQKIVAEQANIQDDDLREMFNYLTHGEVEDFLKIYEKIVFSCTSYFDGKENAYHMLFLGMCMSLRKYYKVTSNLEAGFGRYDILLESLIAENMHIVIEFKQGEETAKLKEEALQQILNQKYYAGLNGMILCLGIAHNKKRCEIAYKIVEVQ